MKCTRIGTLALPVCFGPVALLAQLQVGSDGSDGAFAPTCNATIDLSLSPTASWNTPGNGNGVYDPVKWAVVFKYSTVSANNGTIAAPCTTRFLNHPSGAPVVWLVQGNVVIGAYDSVSVDSGDHVETGQRSIAGPGGFRGGQIAPDLVFTTASGGHGPGGGPIGGSGSYSTGGAGTTYGNLEIVPLVGGSGGGAGCANGGCGGGGAGGGAILIVAGGTITVNGSISADGGDGRTAFGGNQHRSPGGAGGAIRLIASTVDGNGLLLARPGASLNPGTGRVSIVALSAVPLNANPPAEFALPDSPPLIWPPEDAPEIRVAQLRFTDTNQQQQTLLVPSDPRASFSFPNADVTFDTASPVTLDIVASDVPTNWQVFVRVIPQVGAPFIVNGNSLSGSFASSSTTASFSAPLGFSAVQVRAAQP